MDLNLDTLKQEIVEYLEHSEFAIFRSAPGGLEGLPIVLWDAERYPDYQMFLDTARKTGAKMILFAAREFESPEVDEAVEELDECDLSREERRGLDNPGMTYVIATYTVTMRRRAITVGVCAIMVALGNYLAFGGAIGSEFLPHLDEGALWVRGTLAPSTGPDEGIRVSNQARIVL